MFQFEGFYVHTFWGKTTYTCMTCNESAKERHLIYHTGECNWNREVAGLAWHRQKIDKAIDECWEKNHDA